MDSDREPERSVVYPARQDAACASQRAIDTSVLNTFSETLNIFDTTPLQLFQFVFFLNKPMSMISGHSPKYHFKLSLMTLLRTEFHPDSSCFTSIRMVGRMDNVTLRCTSPTNFLLFYHLLDILCSL